MSDYAEAFVSLLPSDAGGRSGAVTPRDGSYRPFARSRQHADSLRVRFIEGPPRLEPGEDALVVVELETSIFEELLIAPGDELDLVEHARVVGIMNVMRLWRSAFAI